MTTLKPFHALLFISSLFLSVQSSAAETCVKSVSEFSAQSANLPEVVRTLPAMLATDGFLVTAGLKIRAAGDKLKLEGYVWKPGDIYVDDAYISKACYDGKTLNVTLENGKSYSARVKDSDSVSIQGVTFDKASEKEFAKIAHKVQGAQERNSKTSSGVQ